MSRALAIGAHPDDIEFAMAGTLLLLRDAGWEVHCLNLASGNLGSIKMSGALTARVRREEAQEAARALGAIWHPPLCHDLQIFYDDATLRKVCAVVRAVAPVVLLTQSPDDPLEDHQTTCRLAVAAAFARKMPNYHSSPARVPVQVPVTIYHSTPLGLRDAMRHRIQPGAFVDTASVHQRKWAALACHTSQREWLDVTQGKDSYVLAMDHFSRGMGALSDGFAHAESWRRHLHVGLCSANADPLREALGSRYQINDNYEQALDRPLATP